MRVSELKQEMDARFDQLDAQFKQVGERLASVEAKIDATAVYTRRHFDVVAEHLRSDIDLIASPAYGVSWHR